MAEVDFDYVVATPRLGRVTAVMMSRYQPRAPMQAIRLADVVKLLEAK